MSLGHRNSPIAHPFDPPRAEPAPARFCARSQPKHEHIAALHLFLGWQTTVELPKEALIREMDERRLVL